jgi:hypothetical protein
MHRVTVSRQYVVLLARALFDRSGRRWCATVFNGIQASLAEAQSVALALGRLSDIARSCFF